MNVLDRSAVIKAGDKEYKLIFPIKSIIGCEKELENKNMIMTFAGLGQRALSIGDTYALLKWGLLGNKKYTVSEIDNIFAECLEEPGIVGVQTAITEALVKSGLLGKNAAALL